MATANQAEWTIMVFLNAKNNLEPFSFKNFLQMAAVGSTPDVNIVVEYGRPRAHYANDYGHWSKTLRFRVTKGMTPIPSNAVVDLGKVNMGSGAALADFVTWSKATYPAKRYMLILWDHGQGWRAFNATSFRGTAADRDRYRAMRRDLRDTASGGGPASIAIPDDEQIHGVVRYVSLDEDTGDKLYNRDIQDSLAAALGANPLDVIGFDACLMAMIESGYALRNVASVLVGSEEIEPGEGWDYQRWLAPLVANPAIFDGPALAKQIVKTYGAAYTEHPAPTTLSAVDLGKMDELAAHVGAFAGAATTRLGPELAAIKAARAACANYGADYGINSIDLGRFLDVLQKTNGVDATLAASASAALASIGSAVLASYASPSRQGNFGSQGLAIYFPSTGFAFQSDPDRQGYAQSNTVFPVEFVQKNDWAKFLQAYFEVVPN